MNTLFRNFWVTLKRFKVATFFNIFGLSAAFAAFAVIMMQVYYDTGFDKFHSKVERTYRLELSEGDGEFSTRVSRNMIQLALASPLVETGSFYAEDWERTYLTVDQNGNKTGFMESLLTVYPEFTAIFDFEMVEGSKDALKEPNSVIIPQRVVTRLFGESTSAIGKTITFQSKTPETLTIGGVFKDFPNNSLLRNDIYTREDKNVKPSWDHWGNCCAQLFLTLHSPDSKAEFEQTLLNQLNEVDHIKQWMPLKEVRLSAIPDIYYQTDIAADDAPKGSRTTTYALLAIALLIIAIASINFINFSTSLAPTRIKSINTKKVLGSPTSVLRKLLIGEALLTSLISFIFSMLWVYALKVAGFGQLLSSGINFGDNLPVIGLSFAVAAIVGILAGLYPAYYITSFPPALVLKGSFGLSPEGKKLRTSLVGFQYIVSIALIITAFTMQLQNDFMRTLSVGLDTKKTAMVTLSQEIVKTHRRTLENLLKESPQVEEITFAYSMVGSSDGYSNWGFGKDANGESMRMEILPGDWNYPQFIGTKLLDGRFFTEAENDASGTKKLVINEAAQKRYGFKVGQKFPANDTEIVGVVENFNFASLRKSIEPMAFMTRIDDEWDPHILHVKTTGAPQEAIDHIHRTIASIDPAYPVNIRLFDSIFNELYASERKTSGLIGIFSLLAVVISLVGVFGLVMFETQYRRKEIGIRKVLGATVTEVLTMFNRNFTTIVVVCFVIAAPIAYIGVKNWLGNFAYRTPIHWWIFGLALVIVLIITVITVTVQSWRAATDNPVNSIRNQ